MCKIMEYKGFVGLTAFNDKEIPEAMMNEPLSLEFLSDALVNDPTMDNQVGFAFDASKCKIDPKAAEILKKLKASEDDIGDISIERLDDMIVLSWLGGPTMLANGDEEGSKNFDGSLFDELELTPVEPEPEFIAAIEQHLLNNSED